MWTKIKSRGKEDINPAVLWRDIMGQENVKDEATTFNLRLVLRLNFMRLDLVPTGEKKAKKPIKVKPSRTKPDMDFSVCV